VDVNVARVGPGVLFLQNPQPQKSAHDLIAAGGNLLEDFAGPLAILEYRAEGRVRADLGRDGHRAERCGVGSVAVAETKLRGRNAIPRDDHAVIDQGEGLIGDADHNGGLGERWGGADNCRSQTNKRDDAGSEKRHTAAYKAVFVPPAVADGTEPANGSENSRRKSGTEEMDTDGSALPKPSRTYPASRRTRSQLRVHQLPRRGVRFVSSVQGVVCNKGL
jgi:hypothetical protein